MRPKKSLAKEPFFASARAYLAEHAPELKDVPLRMHLLDGPADAPRYAISAELCTTRTCPYGVSAADSTAGRCPVHNCTLRCSMRLLLDARGKVLRATSSTIHWQ